LVDAAQQTVLFRHWFHLLIAILEEEKVLQNRTYTACEVATFAALLF